MICLVLTIKVIKTMILVIKKELKMNLMQELDFKYVDGTKGHGNILS